MTNISQPTARRCPVCLGADNHVLFHQDFSAFSEGGLMEGYDLAVCNSCGAAYADMIPMQEVFDAYYADMSKYEDSGSGGKLSDVSAARFRQVVDLVAPALTSDASIADVGCATGGLLAEFKRRGFQRLTGFDPSPVCAQAARRLYNLEVRPVSIQGLTQVQERFDVLLLTGVLEHLCDVEQSLAVLLALLNPGGRVYIEVPDATRYFDWFSAPFQFLSMEHVNFFSPVSLTNLFLRQKLQPLFVKRVDRYLSANAVEPAVAALFELSSADSAGLPVMTRDNETKAALVRYLEQSAAQDRRIAGVISKLIEKQTPLAVWGTGTHTLRLLKAGQLGQAKIVAFIDSNSRYQGKKLQGVPIIGPAEFDRDAETKILISSHVAAREIKAQIEESLRWPNEIICLYDEAPVALQSRGESAA